MPGALSGDGGPTAPGLSPEDAGELRRKTLAGVVWAGIGQLGAQGIHYVALLVFAWWLSPAEFGLFTLGMIFVSLAQSLGELGLAAALVQRQDLGDGALNAVFWSNLAVGLLVGGLTYSGADAITGVLGDRSGGAVLRALAIIFPVAALAVVPTALLQKEMRFDRLGMRELVSEAGFGLAGLAAAAAGAGVWSLVCAAVTQRLVGTASLWAAVRWRPGLTADWKALASLLRFGASTMAASVLARAFSQVDYFVVGRWLGTTALGSYTLAFQLGVVPAQRLVGVLRNVTFPAFSVVQGDHARLRAGFAQTVGSLFAVLVPLSLATALLGPRFIDLAYGEKWLPAASVLPVLAVAGLLHGFDVSEALYFAVGRPHARILILGLRLATFLVTALAVGLSLGVVGVAGSLVVSVALSSFAGFLVVSRVVRAGVWAVARPALPAAFAGVVSALAALTVSAVGVEWLSGWPRLVVCGALLVGCYLIALQGFRWGTGWGLQAGLVGGAERRA